MDLVVLAALTGWLDPSWWWAILQVVLGLGAVIFVHELGHFLAAKSCGVEREKFYVGFDAFDIKIGDRVIIPRKLVHWQRGETEYGVGILPLGGYVKMLGQDDNPSKMAEERERAMMEKGDGVDGTALDPRSYMAKSVPQRMLIISAGVVMNLIFAVIFAAFAFGFGVNYEPPKVGKTVPGSPAWVHNLDGSTITEISGYRTDDPDIYFTFNHLRELIVLDSSEGPLDLEVVRPDSERPQDLSIMAASNLIGVKGGGNLKSLGITPMLGLTLNEPAVLEGQAAARAEPPLKVGDKFLAIDGKELQSGFDMTRILAQKPDKSLTFKVKRKDGTVVDVSMPPNPMNHAGFVMEMGQVRAIRIGSPADNAGILPKDVITKIDGQPVGDPFTLQLRMLMKAREGESVTVTVSRYLAADDQQRSEVELELQPEIPFSPTLFDEERGFTIESLGVNVLAKNIVAEGSEKPGGVRKGDQILAVEFELLPEQEDLETHQNATGPYEFDDNENLWAFVHFIMQSLRVNTPMQLTVKRDGEELDIETRIQRKDGYFLETRGFTPVLAQETYQDHSAWTAIQNGFRQTIDDASRVLKFLKKLIRGDLSLTNLGGPGTIATVAAAEATRGTSRLLLFLTLLSANLAIINFLPIPVLDGGHMMFLIYEGIFRRPVSEKLQFVLTIAGFVFLLALMVTVIGLDIWRLT